MQNKTIVEMLSIAGGEVSSLDKTMSLKIDKRTYYNQW